MKRLVIIGAGGHGKVVADTAMQMAQWDIIEFVDGLFPSLAKIGSWNVVAKNLEAVDYEVKPQFIVAVGENKLRLKLFQAALELGYESATIVHPTAYVSTYTSIGQGSVIFANAVVNIGAELGDCSIINTSSTIDHDCFLGNGVHVSPGAHLAGEVKVGDFSWVGIGAVIKQQIKVGKNVTIGAGASVVSNIADDLTVIGTPAKSIQH